ncbi:MAG: tRNA preQ1(34) S-adenosylmethionine ribosyltransferase-isomerase QueA [Armatimonadetes bacterium]|nr:tRNA preQ1(34) S-adenosylmethionine ribosyltransferase-isomerase QueA [Armatimonadota bacterium]
MDVSLFDYALPSELIAQEPAERRDQSRMMIVDREAGSFRDGRFEEIVGLLRPNDCLVLNDTRVIPARLVGRRMPSGGKAEVFLIRRLGEWEWEVLAKPGKKLRPGTQVSFGEGKLTVSITEESEGGLRRARFQGHGRWEALLDELGSTPLPPYIKRPEPRAEDRERYQTVYARHDGAVAAPTAGLHFTPGILGRLANLGVQTATVTLHVGWGTFQPIDAEQVEDHVMHEEYYEVLPAAADLVNAVRPVGGRIVAVGTTSVRTLETCASEGCVRPRSGWTRCFIYPGYRFQAVDALLTNFHLPRSSLLMLVSAFAGRELTLDAYRAAVERRYRFYSYGDCMFIV